MHPIHTDKPIDSWRMTVIDFGTKDGQDNIKVIKEKILSLMDIIQVL